MLPLQEIEVRLLGCAARTLVTIRVQLSRL